MQRKKFLILYCSDFDFTTYMEITWNSCF